MELKSRAKHKMFDGMLEFFSHPSKACPPEMNFSVYLPPQAAKGACPVLYWLSGLTCTDENFMIKSGAQRFAAKHGVILVAPDTSPRKTGIPGEDETYDIGTGAGFYVNATEPPWAAHYRMYDYVTQELVDIVESRFPVAQNRRGIFGHSMGGHGAMVIALRNPGRYRSVSAFSPICVPSLSPWGQKIFAAYLGPDKKAWAAYDANELVKTVKDRQPILIDQGMADPYLEERLRLAEFEKTCREVNYPVEIRKRDGYDHSYFYISTYIREHLQYHAERL
jgi:S-formylglutathione hydrolase